MHQNHSNLMYPVTIGIQIFAIFGKIFSLKNHISGKEGGTVMVNVSTYTEFNELSFDTILKPFHA